MFYQALAMRKISETQRMFRELHAPVDENIRALLGDAASNLEVIPRDDGALWFILGNREVRMTLAISAFSEIILYVHEVGNGHAIRQFPAVLSADARILAEAIALELTL